MPDPDFWGGKNVFLTGHTGFKGSWTAQWLAKLGAIVTGFSLEPDIDRSLYRIAQVDRDVTSFIGDLRDIDELSRAIEHSQPEIVLHMAAQPLIGRAVAAPVETFAVNVLGTVQLLDVLRGCQKNIKAVLIVTSDKVYANDASGRTFVETDRLGGCDPYSASKAAAELVTASYASSFFDRIGVPCATARAGNIIGGGDFAPNRLVPDVVRAVESGTKVALRHPKATRPWQHVLDCIAGYLLYAEALATNRAIARALNFGPSQRTAVTVAELAEEMLKALRRKPEWDYAPEHGSSELPTLGLDASSAHEVLNWHDRLAGQEGIAWTADWYRAHAAGADMRRVSLGQIIAYSELRPTHEP